MSNHMTYGAFRDAVTTFIPNPLGVEAGELAGVSPGAG